MHELVEHRFSGTPKYLSTFVLSVTTCLILGKEASKSLGCTCLRLAPIQRA